MSAPSFRRTFALLLLVLVFAVPWASAAGFPAESLRSAEAPLDFLGRLWSYFTKLWSGSGCYIDPSGRCATMDQKDSGCYIDPNGRCATMDQKDSGCMIDPNGRCAPMDQKDSGCYIDPDGRCSS